MTTKTTTTTAAAHGTLDAATFCELLHSSTFHALDMLSATSKRNFVSEDNIDAYLQRALTSAKKRKYMALGGGGGEDDMSSCATLYVAQEVQNDRIMHGVQQEFIGSHNDDVVIAGKNDDEVKSGDFCKRASVVVALAAVVGMHTTHSRLFLRTRFTQTSLSQLRRELADTRAELKSTQSMLREMKESMEEMRKSVKSTNTRVSSMQGHFSSTRTAHAALATQVQKLQDAHDSATKVTSPKAPKKRRCEMTPDEERQRRFNKEMQKLAWDATC